ncbi:MAG: signal peptide peptidase SppA, partial [Bacteroidota bacterium]
TEPFFLDKMSPENRQQVAGYINGIWNHVLKSISVSRNISREKLTELADNLSIATADDALKNKMVDQLAYRDEVLSELKKKTGVTEKGKLKFISNDRYSSVSTPDKTADAKDEIAVIYATGDIVSGEGDDQTIGSMGLSAAIRKAREDNKVKAVVLRVNSPGGDALASDVIWREVQLTAASKPMIASFGDVAASGGYYIACGATRIIADPTTITGSIGVFGLVPNMKGLFNNKLGITFDNESTNKNSDYISVTAPLSPFQTNVLQKEIEHIYGTFVSKVAKGRHKTETYIDSIAQGRVWCAGDAKNLGLVDDFGGLEIAINSAAELAKIKNYKVINLPEQKEIISQILDEIMGSTKSALIERELGDDYQYYQYVKKIRSMKSIQARLPFEVVLN